MLGKFLPDFVIDRFGARKLLEGLAQFLPPGFIALFASGKADDSKLRRHLLFFIKMIESRNEFARGQVAAGPENHNRTGRKRFALFAEMAGSGVIHN